MARVAHRFCVFYVMRFCVITLFMASQVATAKENTVLNDYYKFLEAVSKAHRIGGILKRHVCILETG